MPTLRSLLGGHALALRALGELSWLMDVDVVDVHLAERAQLIMIQSIATVYWYEKLRDRGSMHLQARATPLRANVSMADCLRICEYEGILTIRQQRWLWYMHRRANAAKHEVSRL